jgi:hypothetical protein
MGAMTEEFNSDKEYCDHYLSIVDGLQKMGWKEGKRIKNKRKVSTLFTKNGYGAYILFGCEEELKNELF